MRLPHPPKSSLFLAAIITAFGCTNTVTVVDDGGSGGTNSGGSNTGGNNQGGSNTGGANTGGTNTGGNQGGSSSGGASVGGANTGGSSQGGGPPVDCETICEDWLLCTVASDNCAVLNTNADLSELDEAYSGCLGFCAADPAGGQMLGDTMDQNRHHESVTDLRAANPDYVDYCGSTAGLVSSNPNLFCGDLVADMVFCLASSAQCPGITAQTPGRDLWLLKASGLEACDGPLGAAIDGLVDPQNCDGTADNLRSVNMDIDDLCQ